MCGVLTINACFLILLWNLNCIKLATCICYYLSLMGIILLLGISNLNKIYVWFLVSIYLSWHQLSKLSKTHWTQFRCWYARCKHHRKLFAAKFGCWVLIASIFIGSNKQLVCILNLYILSICSMKPLWSKFQNQIL